MRSPLRRETACPNALTHAAGGDLRRTALREAEEEMGPLPPHRAGASYLTHRGKARTAARAAGPAPSVVLTRQPRRLQRGQKHYTIFVCEMQAAARAAFAPALNEEHREARWFAPAAVRAALAGGTEPPAPLHPVVEALLRQHPDALAAA